MTQKRSSYNWIRLNAHLPCVCVLCDDQCNYNCNSITYLLLSSLFWVATQSSNGFYSFNIFLSDVLFYVRWVLLYFLTRSGCNYRTHKWNSIGDQLVMCYKTLPFLQLFSTSVSTDAHTVFLSFKRTSNRKIIDWKLLSKQNSDRGKSGKSKLSIHTRKKTVWNCSTTR